MSFVNAPESFAQSLHCTVAGTALQWPHNMTIIASPHNRKRYKYTNYSIHYFHDSRYKISKE